MLIREDFFHFPKCFSLVLRIYYKYTFISKQIRIIYSKITSFLNEFRATAGLNLWLNQEILPHILSSRPEKNSFPSLGGKIRKRTDRFARRIAKSIESRFIYCPQETRILRMYIFHYNQCWPFSF